MSKLKNTYLNTDSFILDLLEQNKKNRNNPFMTGLKQGFSQGKKLKEKKIGFNRGPEYSDEAVDLLGDLAKSADMLNKELEKKVLDSNDPKVQEILNLLDDNLSIDSEFLTYIQTILDLIEELPDKPTERPKIGFR